MATSSLNLPLTGTKNNRGAYLNAGVHHDNTQVIQTLLAPEDPKFTLLTCFLKVESQGAVHRDQR